MFDAVETLDSRSGAALRLYRCHAKEPARGVLLIFHGLAEHAGRYGAAAESLASLGFHVYAHDHRGHGSTVAPDAPFRRFARRNGAEKVLADCRQVHQLARERHADLPIFVLGHSMGGIIALAYTVRHPREIAGVAVWNADVRQNAERRVGGLVLKVEKALKGSDVASAVLQRATVGAWAKSVPDRRTEYDWLSNRQEAVDAYIADPLCGFTPTVSMMEDVLQLIRQSASPHALDALPRDLPVHILGGGSDPVTENGRAMLWLGETLTARGMRDITSTIIDGSRHETLNELEQFREPALSSLSVWLDRRSGTKPPR